MGRDLPLMLRNRKSATPHPQPGCAFKERYLSFHHLTSCPCSSWLTQTRFSPAPASPPNTIGFTYHFTFPNGVVLSKSMPKWLSICGKRPSEAPPRTAALFPGPLGALSDFAPNLWVYGQHSRSSDQNQDKRVNRVFFVRFKDQSVEFVDITFGFDPSNTYASHSFAATAERAFFEDRRQGLWKA